MSDYTYFYYEDGEYFYPGTSVLRNRFGLTGGYWIRSEFSVSTVRCSSR